MHIEETNADAFEEFLLRTGILEERDLRDLHEAKNNINVTLGMIALNHGVLTSVEIKQIVDAQGKTNKKFGEVAVELELMNEGQLVRLLAEHARINFDVGEMLVLNGRLSPAQLEEQRRAFAQSRNP